MTTPRPRSGRPGVFRTLPVEQISEETAEGGLQRSLSLWQLTAIGVGGIIGAGIFALAGSVANTKAGPAVLISFLIAGVASAAAAFSYAEFALHRLHWVVGWGMAAAERTSMKLA